MDGSPFFVLIASAASTVGNSHDLGITVPPVIGTEDACNLQIIKLAMEELQTVVKATIAVVTPVNAATKSGQLLPLRKVKRVSSQQTEIWSLHATA